jgi:hypothetical protein
MTSSTQQIEREVEQSRADVEHTVEELKDRLSAGQLVDQAARYFRESGGGETLQQLGAQVRANPLPLALVGIGLAWLMSGKGPPHVPSGDDRYREGRRYPSEPDDPGAAYRTHGAAGALYGAGSGQAAHSGDGGEDIEGGGIRDALDGARDRMSSAASSLGESASDAAERARAGVSAAAEAGGEAWESAGRVYHRTYRGASAQAQSAYRGAQSTFFDLLEREPLVIGAVGVAVGAAIGAMLPRTEIEDRYVGEAAEMARTGMEVGKDTAETAYEAATNKVQEEAERSDTL